MHLDEDLDVRADSITHRFHETDYIVLLRPLHLVEAGAKRIELERFVALVEHSFCGCVELIRRPSPVYQPLRSP